MVRQVPAFGDLAAAIKRPRGVAATLIVGLTAIAVAIVVVLSHSPARVIAGNSIPTASNYIELEERGRLSECQPAGTIPAGASDIRLGIEGLYFSPSVSAVLLDGTHAIATGSHPPGGPSTPNVTVPVQRIGHAVHAATLCMAVGPALEPIRYYGASRHSGKRARNPLQEATLQLNYLVSGSHSWSSSLSSISYHMGLGHSPGGGGVIFLVVALMLTAVAATCRLALRELR
jgi:hypothetical protein